MSRNDVSGRKSDVVFCGFAVNSADVIHHRGREVSRVATTRFSCWKMPAGKRCSPSDFRFGWSEGQGKDSAPHFLFT